MSTSDSSTVRLKVAPQVAEIVGPGASRAAQLSAARGALPLSGGELLTVLCLLCASADQEVKGEAVRTLRAWPEATLLPVVDEPTLHPRLLDLLARVRMTDLPLVERICCHPQVSETTLCFLAQRGNRAILECLARIPACLTSAVVVAIAANPEADATLRLGLRPGQAEPAADADADVQDGEEDGESGADVFPEAIDGNPDEVEEISDEEIAARLEEGEVKGQSKHQIALEMKVSEKIKIAMTGDKEWRNILVKDPNKLVHGAVMKNGRITEAEVVAVARSKTSSDELVRLILLNREWMKNSEIRRALALHPKTPLPKAMRFVSELPLNDLKKLMKSRSVSSAISTTARKEVENRMKRGGG